MLQVPAIMILAANLGFELPAEEEARIVTDAETVIRVQTAALDTNPRDLEALSRRGDAWFILAKFSNAASDYDAMARIDPAQDASHWRRGIAWFYAGEYEKAAGQFERYHSYDNVDRENGIWRYLSQVKHVGVEEARRGLLKYEKDDREPFPDVFRLFAGTVTPDEIARRINEAEISDDQREQRRFYADLYIGLNHAVENRDAEAKQFLQRAVDNTWAPKASYGPRWMWHVARVHRQQLEKVKPEPLPESPSP